jgi:hypothetical protein
MIDSLQNCSDAGSPSNIGAISGYQKMIHKPASGAPYSIGEIKNLLLACDAFLLGMRRTVSFMSDPALRSETRARMRQVEAFRSKISRQTQLP